MLFCWNAWHCGFDFIKIVETKTLDLQLRCIAARFVSLQLAALGVPSNNLYLQQDGVTVRTVQRNMGEVRNLFVVGLFLVLQKNFSLNFRRTGKAQISSNDDT
jgi:hypothetical protein